MQHNSKSLLGMNAHKRVMREVSLVILAFILFIIVLVLDCWLGFGGLKMIINGFQSNPTSILTISLGALKMVLAMFLVIPTILLSMFLGAFVKEFIK